MHSTIGRRMDTFAQIEPAGMVFPATLALISGTPTATARTPKESSALAPARGAARLPRCARPFSLQLRDLSRVERPPRATKVGLWEHRAGWRRMESRPCRCSARHRAPSVCRQCCLGLQTAYIVAPQGCVGFGFHSYHSACAIFQNDGHFLRRGCAPVEEFPLSSTPSGQLPHLHEHKVFQNTAGQVCLPRLAVIILFLPGQLALL